jgi:hypothetical protein
LERTAVDVDGEFATLPKTHDVGQLRRYVELADCGVCLMYSKVLCLEVRPRGVAVGKMWGALAWFCR